MSKHATQTEIRPRDAAYGPTKVDSSRCGGWPSTEDFLSNRCDLATIVGASRGICLLRSRYSSRHPEVRDARRKAPCGEPRRMNAPDSAAGPSPFEACSAPLSRRSARTSGVTVADNARRGISFSFSSAGHAPTSDMRSRSRGAIRPSFARLVTPSIEGRREGRVPTSHPRSAARKRSARRPHSSIQV